jgi:NAD(P)-dependent dehydrogenase (short-subunit alcohol dehydrogenase family)
MILDLFKLTDLVAIVTGAGKGIGRGIAFAFAEAGADVVCVARPQADIDAVADEVRRRGQRALAVAPTSSRPTTSACPSAHTGPGAEPEVTRGVLRASAP